jgi:hypothetical protein
MSIAYLDLDEALVAPLTADSAVLALLGDTPTRLYATLAPQAVIQTPYAVFSVVSATVLNRTPTSELDVVYRLETYADTREGAQTAQAIIHEAMMAGHFSAGGYTCYRVAWLGGTGGATSDGGQIMWRMSGEYRLWWVGG